MKKDTELVEPFSMPNAEDFQNDFDFPNATLLGSGSFGKVYKAAWKRTGEFKAVKIVESINEDAYLSTLKEFQLNRVINIHPNVVHIEKVYSWSEESPVMQYVLVLVMKLAEGSLKDLRIEYQQKHRKATTFDDQEIVDIAGQLVTIFEFLKREKGFYHRDVKPENILFEKANGRILVKVTDFGVSKALQDSVQKTRTTMQNANRSNGLAMLKNSLVGTPLYLSPKLWDAYISGQTSEVKHDLEKSDVYSLGLTLLQTYLLLNDPEICGINDSTKKSGPMFISRIHNQKLAGLLNGMLAFEEKPRFNWTQCIQYLFPEQANSLKSNQYLGSEQKYLVPIKYDRTFEAKTSKIKLRLVQYIVQAQKNVVFEGQIICGDQIASFTKEQLLIHDSDGVLVHQQQVQSLKQLIYLEESKQCIGYTSANKLIVVTSVGSFDLDLKNLHPITTIHTQTKNIFLTGHNNGEITIYQLANNQANELKVLKDHTSAILVLLYDSSDEFLFSADQSKVVSVRFMRMPQIASQKLDYPVEKAVRINKKGQIAVCGFKQTEILLLEIKEKNHLQLEIMHTISLHTSIPMCMLMIQNQCFLVPTEKEIMLYDTQALRSEQGHLALKDIPLLFYFAHWHQNKGYLIVSDKEKISKWQIEYDGQILGGELLEPNQQIGAKKCCCFTSCNCLKNSRCSLM